MLERVQELLGRIPGYTAYRDKEHRRDEDKRVREAIADGIMQGVDRLTQYNARLAEQRDLGSLSRIESLVGRVRLLADRIRTASYGYGGLFTERSVDEAALDQLRQFDLALQREVQGLATRIEALTQTSTPADERVEDVSEELDRLELLFASRSGVIDEARPTREARILDLLDTTPAPTPSPLLSVGRGVAFSVLGDDFLADATITLATPDGPLQLIRVGRDDASVTWFLGSGVPSVPSARLTEVDATEGPALEATARASATIESERGRQEGVAVRYAVERHDDGSVAMALLIGSEPRVFRGNEIRDIDVDVYGAA